MLFNAGIVRMLSVRLVIAIICASVFSIQMAAAQDVPLIFVEGDETSTELEILNFLNVRTNWDIERAEFGENLGDDSYLRIPFTLGDGRGVTILVDSLPSAQDNAERRVQVYGWIVTGVKEDHARRAELLELLNSVQQTDWMSHRLYLDRDGDVAFAWSINIPGKRAPVHAEQVYDAIIRMKLMLDNLSPKLNDLDLF